MFQSPSWNGQGRQQAVVASGLALPMGAGRGGNGAAAADEDREQAGIRERGLSTMKGYTPVSVLVRVLAQDGENVP